MVYSCEYCEKFIANNKIDTEEVKLIYSSDWESFLKLEIKSLTEQGKENELWRLYL